MKTRAILTVLALLLLLGLYGCLETGLGDGSGADDGNPALGDLSNSGCKDGTAKEAKHNHNGEGWEEGENGEDTDDAAYNGVIKAKVGDRSVTIMHLDAVYECQAEIIYMLEASGSNLILTEVDSAEVQSYCTCSFDLSVDILNLTNGRTYHAEVWNADKTVMFGAVDFTPGACNTNECVSDDDCWRLMEENGMAWPDCEGNFACIEGTCQWQCTEWPTNCYSDSDCPSGYYCAWEYYGNPGEEKCWYDESGREICEPGWDEGYGTCQPIQNWECSSDYDCPEGYFCNMYYPGNSPEGYPSDCWTNADGSMECKDGMPPAYGYCEPRSYECYSDSDCPSGYFCNYVAWADDSTKPEDDCWTNPDGSQDCGGAMPPSYGYCEPIQTGECWSNADCPEGYYCAWADGGSANGEDCWIDDAGNTNCQGYYGYCLPYSGQECKAAEECYAMYGDPMIECADARWSCDYGYCNQVCGGGDYQCWSDYDCPQGASCVYYEECNDPSTGDCRGGSYCEYQTECGASADCPAGMFCSNGVCIGEVPAPCNTDADCAYGEVCMEGLCTANGGTEPCGDNGECAPGEVCDWCPPDPNCPMCDVCGKPVCVRGL